MAMGTDAKLACAGVRGLSGERGAPRAEFTSESETATESGDMPDDCERAGTCIEADSWPTSEVGVGGIIGYEVPETIRSSLRDMGRPGELVLDGKVHWRRAAALA
jgi:hypothetical protein